MNPQHDQCKFLRKVKLYRTRVELDRTGEQHSFALIESEHADSEIEYLFTFANGERKAAFLLQYAKAQAFVDSRKGGSDTH